VVSSGEWAGWGVDAVALQRKRTRAALPILSMWCDGDSSACRAVIEELLALLLCAAWEQVPWCPSRTDTVADVRLATHLLSGVVLVAWLLIMSLCLSGHGVQGFVSCEGWLSW